MSDHYNMIFLTLTIMGGWRGGTRGLEQIPFLGKSQVTLGFLRKSGTDPDREAIGPLGSSCFLAKVHTAPSVKYVDD